MANILIVVYLLIVLAMIGVILLQRSEGGALGTGGNNGGFSQVRSSANLLTRTTAILGALFMATAIGLSIVNEIERGSNSILDNVVVEEGQEAPATILDALNQISGEENASPEQNNEASPAQEETPIDAPNLPLPTQPAAPTNN